MKLTVNMPVFSKQGSLSLMSCWHIAIRANGSAGGKR